MKIIGLIGKSNSGKTSSLKYSILQMLNLNEIKILYSSRLFSNNPKQLKEKYLIIGKPKQDISKTLHFY